MFCVHSETELDRDFLLIVVSNERYVTIDDDDRMQVFQHAVLLPPDVYLCSIVDVRVLMFEYSRAFIASEWYE